MPSVAIAAVPATADNGGAFERFMLGQLAVADRSAEGAGVFAREVADRETVDRDAYRVLVVRVVVLQRQLGAFFDVDAVFAALANQDGKAVEVKGFTSHVDRVFL